MDINEQLIEQKTTYKKWQEEEGIRVIEGFYIEDLKAVPLDPWERMGGLGAFINLTGTDDENDTYVCQIPPGVALKPQKHLFEEIIYVLAGGGTTTVWNEGGKKQTFEWQTGSLFSVPLNAWHQHFNVRGDVPALFISVTTAPTVINLFHNLDFVFGDSFIFKDRFNGEPDYFSETGKTYGNGRYLETNFVPDIINLPLQEYKERGAGGRNIKIELANNTLTSHISEFPIGTYKKAHRHGAGAHVIILSGQGYSLMWKEGEPIQKFDWKPGSIIVPPDQWFHQHFNTGPTPARYLAIRWHSIKNPIRSKVYSGARSVELGGDQIEYSAEDPAIRDLFENELKKNGVESRMNDVLAAKA